MMNKKMLRDILPKNNNLSTKRITKSENDILYHKVSPNRASYNDGRKSRKIIWSLAGIVVLGVILTIFYTTAGVKVILTPRTYTKDVGVNLVAFNKDLGSATDNSDSQEPVLYFKEMVVSKIGGKDVLPDGQRMVERKASGKITIYNNFSSSEQRLIKNTRFESPDGRIFRINRSVVVPGQKKVDGKIVPGSVEAIVYADEPGKDYNLNELVNFTIPGLKSSPERYSKFYAKNTEPIVGGFVGMTKQVSDENQKIVRAEIRASLKSAILDESINSLADGLMVPKDGYVVEFESLPNKEKDNSVSIREKATLTMFVFENTAWDFAISSKSVLEDIGKSEVYIKNRDDLNIQWIDRPKKNVPQINFKVSGPADFVWVIDSEGLKKALAGRKKRDLDIITSDFPAIKSAKAIISPIWRRSFPDNKDEIEVVVEIPDKNM